MKDIINYEGLYAVTSCGKIWSYVNKKFLKPYTVGYGYLYVRLFKEGKSKQMYVHRLVAEAYIPNPNNYEQVNHINEKKTDNYIGNLEWCCAKYNTNYGTRNKKLAEAKFKKVKCIETGIIYNSMIEAGIKTNTNYSSIGNCCKGRYKTAGGYHWEYLGDD